MRINLARTSGSQGSGLNAKEVKHVLYTSPKKRTVKSKGQQLKRHVFTPGGLGRQIASADGARCSVTLYRLEVPVRSIPCSLKTYFWMISLRRPPPSSRPSTNSTKSAVGATSRKEAANVTSWTSVTPTAVPRHRSRMPTGGRLSLCS